MKKTSNFNLALWLGIGQFATFLITCISAPVLARYLDKTEYGTYKQILYVFTSLQALFAMGLPNVFAYFIPKLNKGQQKLLVNRMTQLFFILGLILSILLFVLSDVFARLLNNSELSLGLKLFSPFPLFTLPTLGVEGIYTALQRTKEFAIYQVVTKLLTFCCIVIPVVLFNFGYKEAIIGWGCASLITFLIAMYMKNTPFRNESFEVIPNIYKNIFSYTLPLAGAFIAGFIINAADQFFISRYYGISSFAEFTNGNFSLPFIAMVAGSVKGVLLPLLSKADETKEFDSALVSYNNAVIKISVILLPMIIFCMFNTEEIMVVLFGKQYYMSKDFFFMHLIRDLFEIFPYFAVLMAFGYSKFYMNIHIVGIFFIWICDYVIVSIGAPSYFIVLVSSSFQAIIRISAFIYIFYKTRIVFLSFFIIKHILKIIVQCCCLLFIIRFLRTNIGIDYHPFINLCFSGTLFYFSLLVLSKITAINYFESISLLLKRH